MSNKKHKCAEPECDKMIAIRAKHCRNHVPRTREWIDKQAKAQYGKILSIETRQKISASQAENTIAVCQYCEKEFPVKKSRLLKGNGKYCSNKCNYAARSGENSQFWNGGKKEYTCDQCGQIFYRRPCLVTGKNHFCSYSCNSIYKKSRQKTKRTNIEKIMADGLSEYGYNYKEQVSLCNSTIADFFLPEFNIAIFCDGDYWHNYPHGKPKDKIQTQTLINNGYKVLRFWGSDIKSNIGQCIQQIRDAAS